MDTLCENAILSGNNEEIRRLFSYLTMEDDIQDVIDMGMLNGLAFCDIEMLAIFWPHARHKYKISTLSQPEEVNKLRNIILPSYLLQPFKWEQVIDEMDEESCFCGDCVLTMAKRIKFDVIDFWQKKFDKNWPYVLKFLIQQNNSPTST